MKRALITGITGQDGSYLAELLIGHGYEVHGLVRRVAVLDSRQRTERIAAIRDRLTLHPGDITDYRRVLSVFRSYPFDECYHLAAQSFVAESFEDPFATLRANIDGTLHVLEAIRTERPKCRLYFAATSEMFGNAEVEPQTETTPLRPRSPYAVSKVAGFDLCRNYREAHKLHISCGILFNHESPRRGSEFVTRKITLGLARIKAGLEDHIRLGNLDTKRDWGHAADYVRAMHAMLQCNDPGDYVIATGHSHRIRHFLTEACRIADLDPEKCVRIDSTFCRPTDVFSLRGDYRKATLNLGWFPTVSLDQIIAEMMQADLRRYGLL